ncbi:MAG: S9 family peptidase [Bacteroidota bacterium]|nr:S9 family peptidase [Bacteroidota bacterium]
MKKIITLSLVALLATSYTYAQKKELTVQDLMMNKIPNDFLTTVPTVSEWKDDDHVVLMRRTVNGQQLKELLDVKTGKTAPVTDENITNGTSVYVKNNDIFLKKNGVEKKLTNDEAEEKNPTFSPDSNYIAYTKNNNLYTYNLSTGKEKQLTTDGNATTLNGYASWVYYEEIYGRPTHYRAFWWSPDSKTLAYAHFDESMVPMFPIYNSDGQHGFLEQTRYPKVGDKNPEVKIGFVQPDGGTTVWAAFNEKDDQYFGWPIWRESNHTMWLPWMNRGQDHLIIYEVNTATGEKKAIYNETQKTWIDLEDMVGGRINFLKDDKGFIAQSDQSGWNHLYLYAMDGTLKNAITSGNFTVLGIKYIDEKANTVYFTARGRENTARVDLYSVQLDGNNLKRLTFGAYNHNTISLSPTAKYFITTYSNAVTPTQVTIVDNKGKIIRELGNMKGAAFDQYAIAKTELIHIKSEDALFDLPAMVTWPAHFDPNKKYPMLISIYGGPNAGTVWDSWQWNATREMYAREGLIQVAFDHRASGHFGKQGVNYMYRNLGYWEMKDYKTMAKWFIEHGAADPAKICITGFSYGGYMTCYALTYGSDVFTHGMAGGSVVDWHLYDSHYTERYMDTPDENPEGYKTSSVLSYIDRYKGMLQIVHGTMDDNVHMQNSIQLIGTLEDKGKDFEFMLYPGGRHGWPNLPARAKHFQNLKTKFIYKYLLEKPVPAGMLK